MTTRTFLKSLLCLPFAKKAVAKSVEPKPASDIKIEMWFSTGMTDVTGWSKMVEKGDIVKFHTTHDYREWLDHRQKESSTFGDFFNGKS